MVIFVLQIHTVYKSLDKVSSTEILLQLIILLVLLQTCTHLICYYVHVV